MNIERFLERTETDILYRGTLNDRFNFHARRNDEEIVRGQFGYTHHCNCMGLLYYALGGYWDEFQSAVARRKSDPTIILT